MNYDQQITELVETIKADKSVVQPWRNKAVARLEEAQAFAWMGKTISTRVLQDDRCICPDGAVDTACPLHGGA